MGDELATKFKFVCTCECCRLDDESLSLSDSRRCKMHALDRKLASLLQASEVHEGVNAIIHYVSCLATLIDDELGGNPKLKARAYYSGSQLAFAAECEAGAQEMLEKMYDEALLTVGDDGDVLSSL